MNKLRIGILSIALATLTASGCPLISGQFLVKFDLPTPLQVTVAGAVTRANVDLNTISEYKDHKKNMKDVADFALLGMFTNNTTPAAAINLSLWITPGTTNYTTVSQVIADGTARQVWGPFPLAASQSKKIDWDDSAKLFTESGKQELLAEIKGDGTFTAYLVSSGAALFTVQNGVFAIVVDAGQ